LHFTLGCMLSPITSAQSGLLDLIFKEHKQEAIHKGVFFTAKSKDIPSTRRRFPNIVLPSPSQFGEGALNRELTRLKEVAPN
jgi:hypothetical protein